MTPGIERDHKKEGGGDKLEYKAKNIKNQSARKAVTYVDASSVQLNSNFAIVMIEFFKKYL